MRTQISAAAAVLTLALAVPALAAGGRAPHSTAPAAKKAPVSKLDGSGAPYLDKTGKILSGARTLHVRGHATVTSRTTKGQAKSQTANFELALAPGGKFMSRSDGPSGEQVLVGTGSAVYIYQPAKKEVVKLPASEGFRGATSIYNQLMLLMGVGPKTWTYKGIHTVDNRACDEVASTRPGATSTIYLDRTTHLPKRVVLTGNSQHESGGLTADFDLFQMNGAVPASLFKFTPPRGVKVILPKPAAAPKK